MYVRGVLAVSRKQNRFLSVLRVSRALTRRALRISVTPVLEFFSSPRTHKHLGRSGDGKPSPTTCRGGARPPLVALRCLLFPRQRTAQRASRRHCLLFLATEVESPCQVDFPARPVAKAQPHNAASHVVGLDNVTVHGTYAIRAIVKAVMLRVRDFFGFFPQIFYS
jgi:hypothetical protein